MTTRSNVGAIRHFATSCGLLLIPAVVWNLLLTDRLPPAFSASVFWRDIPRPLSLLENVSRALVFAVPFFIPLDISAPGQRRRMLIFAAGTLVCFASWLALIAAPSSAWSVSAVGFLAPAYTPALWLPGLALLGRQLNSGNWYRWWMYLPLNAVFLAAHIGHTWLIYGRIQSCRRARARRHDSSADAIRAGVPLGCCASLRRSPYCRPRFLSEYHVPNAGGIDASGAILGCDESRRVHRRPQG